MSSGNFRYRNHFTVTMLIALSAKRCSFNEQQFHFFVPGLEAVSSMPQFYPLFVQLNVVPSLLSLLSHENTGKFAHESELPTLTLLFFLVVFRVFVVGFRRYCNGGS